MKTSKLRGWQYVFRFTLIQTLKSKGTLITTLVLFLLAVASLPFAGFVMQMMEDGDTKKATFEEVYVADETGFSETDFAPMVKDSKKFSEVTFIKDNRGAGEIEKELEKADETGKAILMVVSYKGDVNMFEMRFTYGAETKVREDDVNALSEIATEYYKEQLINNLEIEKEKLESINQSIKTKVIKTNKDGERDSDNSGTSISDTDYVIVYIVLFVFLLAVSFSAEGISTSIVTEKSSRIIEYLLTAVTPMAVIIGKVLARLLTVFIQFVFITLGCLISIIIVFIGSGGSLDTLIGSTGLNLTAASRQTSGGEVLKFVDDILSKDVFAGLTPISFFVGLLILLVGFLMYGVLAGLFAATASKIEEAAETMKMFSMVEIIGAYLALAVLLVGLSAEGNKILEYIAFILPLSSVFILPPYMWLGKVSLQMGLLSLLILFATFYVLLVIVARVYENMLFHNGNILKIKDIIKLLQSKEKEAKS